MKIAIFHNLPPGGAQRTVYEQAKGLKKNNQLYFFHLTNLNQKFFSLRPFCQQTQPFIYQSTSQLPGPLNRLHQDYHNFVTLSQVHQKIAQIIDQNNFDACLLHPDKHTQAPFLLKHLKTPSFYYCHELLRLAYEPELAIPPGLSLPKRLYEQATRKIRKQIDKQNANQASLILTNSRFILKKINQAYQPQALLCYPGVDTQVFKPYKTKKINQILFIAVKDKLTGYGLLKKALSLIKSSLKPQLKIIDKFNLTDKQLVKIYSQSLATLCLSYHEPFGSTSLESMACATPVIAINQGGYKETVIDKKTGYLVPRNPQALADKIVQLIKHPSIANKMGRSGQQHVKKNFTWQVHNQILEKQLTKLIS